MLSLKDVWPLFGLELRTPRLVLRAARDEDLPGLVDAALAGIHDPDVMPFGVAWTDAPREQLILDTARHIWTVRARSTPDDWTLQFAVLLDGRPIGLQDLRGTQFRDSRTVSSGSWLTQAEQGKGLGIEMRAAVLTLALDHLGAEVAHTEAAEFNAPSNGVSRHLGYQPNGVGRHIARGRSTAELRHRMIPSDFRRPDWTLQVTGLDPVLAQLGLDQSQARSGQPE